MKLFLAYQHLLFLLSLTSASCVVAKYVKAGCRDKCGNNVTIPYPFGIGADCSVNEWYIVECKSSKPYLSALNQLEVLGVNLQDEIVTVNTPMVSNNCENQVGNTSIDLGRSPFLFSKSHNKFVFEGCGNAFVIEDGSVVTGCSTTCLNDTSVIKRNKCYGISCCQATISHYLKSYIINVTGLGLGDGGGCGYALLVDDQGLYVEGNFSLAVNNGFVPVSLMWTLTSTDIPRCCAGAGIPTVQELTMANGISVESRKCSICTRHVQGNPYLPNGCEGIEGCARCPNNTYCDYDIIYDGDGESRLTNFTCGFDNTYIPGSKSSSMGVILGVSISIGVLFLVAASYILYKWIKKTKERRQRKMFFKRNGGLILKQQEEADSSLIGNTIHFTSRELDKATDNFNENRILGLGAQGTVYKGMLGDGRIVAIKKSKVVDESQLEQFINEVVILSQINHRNVVKLLGCCLETDVPLLVSEFIPNGTLYDLLHNGAHEFPVSLNMRLQIATEVATALAYLHSATSISIYHRDIKTTNILLDDKYRAKVSDFGTSRFVSIEQTHLTTLVKGTFGYLDPEYFQTGQFTEKSDVYSFGVVLVELLTGEKPISLSRLGENRSLATHFILAMEEERVLSIFDAIVTEEGTRDELLALANLAMRCLNLNGKSRPTMKEVAIELEALRTSHIPSAMQTNIRPMMHVEEVLTPPSSTFLSFNGSSSS